MVVLGKSGFISVFGPDSGSLREAILAADEKTPSAQEPDSGASLPRFLENTDYNCCRETKSNPRRALCRNLVPSHLMAEFRHGIHSTAAGVNLRLRKSIDPCVILLQKQ
jgi:hypothetical protein